MGKIHGWLRTEAGKYWTHWSGLTGRWNAVPGLRFIHSACIEIMDRQLWFWCLTAASDGNRQIEVTEVSPSCIAVLKLALDTWLLSSTECTDFWPLAIANFMYLGPATEALDSKDLGILWNPIANERLLVLSCGFFQPTLSVFLLPFHVFFLNWLLSNHSVVSSAVIILCKNLCY